MRERESLLHPATRAVHCVCVGFEVSGVYIRLVTGLEVSRLITPLLNFTITEGRLYAFAAVAAFFFLGLSYGGEKVQMLYSTHARARRFFSVFIVARKIGRLSRGRLNGAKQLELQRERDGSFFFWLTPSCTV